MQTPVHVSLLDADEHVLAEGEVTGEGFGAAVWLADGVPVAPIPVRCTGVGVTLRTYWPPLDVTIDHPVQIGVQAGRTFDPDWRGRPVFTVTHFQSDADPKRHCRTCTCADGRDRPASLVPVAPHAEPIAVVRDA